MRRRARPMLVLALLCVLLTLGTVSASAASRVRPAVTFTVNSTLDLPDAAPGNGVCASAPHPIITYCTLRAAIQEANAEVGLDGIALQSGATYNLTNSGSGEDAAATGDLDVRGPLTIVGNGSTIDGQGSDRVFDVFSWPRKLQLGIVSMSALTIRNGRTPDTGYGGGGMLVEMNAPLTLSGVQVSGSSSLIGGGMEILSGAVVHLTSSTITGNSAYHSPSLGDGYSGGIGSDGQLTLTDSAVTGNHAVIQGAGVQSFGGSITLVRTSVSDNVLTNLTGAASGSGLVFGGDTLTIQDSTIDHNTTNAIGGDGGGLLLGANGTGTISGTAITRNNAFDGGGVEAGPGTWTFSNDTIAGNTGDANAGGIGATGSTVSISGSVVSGNTAGAEGGGIAVANGAAMTITGSTVGDNSVGSDTSAGYGGGITQSFPSSSSLTVTGSTISGNHALGGGDGGGVYNGWGASVTNTTISDNEATGRGGGIFNSAQIPLGPITLAGVATLVNSTVAGNTAAGGGDGVFNDAGRTVNLTNTIIAANGTQSCSGVMTSHGHNVDAGESCALSGTGDLSSTDPLLGPLADNGGPTRTQARAVHSPALDAADPAACPAADQRGVARPQDGDLDGTPVCDIGAYEFVAPPDLSVTSTDAPDPIVAGQTLTYDVTVHNSGPGSAPDVTFTDQLPFSAVYGSATPGQGSCAEAAGQVTCDLGALAEGDDASVTITMTPIQPGSDEGLAFTSGGPVEVDMENNAASQETLVTKAKKTVYIAVEDGAFVPDSVKSAFGKTVQWNGLTSAPTSVSDASGMGLFDSGTLDPPAPYSFVFVGAGTYPVVDAASDTGTVKVGLKASGHGSVGVAFPVTWASAAPPAGDVFDVQVKTPGAGWIAWQTGVTGQQGSYTASGAGSYRFRARLRDPSALGSCPGASGQACSGWSPAKSVKVT